MPVYEGGYAKNPYTHQIVQPVISFVKGKGIKNFSLVQSSSFSKNIKY